MQDRIDDFRLLQMLDGDRESGWITLSDSALCKMLLALSGEGLVEAKFRITDAGTKVLEDA